MSKTKAQTKIFYWNSRLHIFDSAKNQKIKYYLVKGLFGKASKLAYSGQLISLYVQKAPFGKCLLVGSL